MYAQQNRVGMGQQGHAVGSEVGTIQSSAVQSSAEQCRVVQSSAEQCRAVQSSAKQYRAVQSRAHVEE